MGFLRSGHGRVEIESRRESFFVHWGFDEDDPGYDPKEPIQKIWDEGPHPEFGYEELDNLIAALIDLRDNDDRLAEWKQKKEVLSVE